MNHILYTIIMVSVKNTTFIEIVYIGILFIIGLNNIIHTMIIEYLYYVVIQLHRVVHRTLPKPY